jgi:hypothetical protein
VDARPAKEAHEHAVHLNVGVREHDAVAPARALGPEQHASLHVQRLALGRPCAATLLRRETRRARGRTPSLLTAELLVVDRIRLAQPLALLLRELDVACPRTHAALGDAELVSDHADREPLLPPQPPSLVSLDLLHERMFASEPDGKRLHSQARAPMV